MAANQPLIVILGQTATGKTELAISLAKVFNGEIINADSSLVRRGVDIGTAKPSNEQLKMVKHHLIDIVEPDEEFTAATYKEQASAAIDAVHQKGKLPFLVGGTGMYIDCLIYDYSFRPPSDPDVRRRLNETPTEQLVLELKAKHLLNDSMDLSNRHRLIRLLETGGQHSKRKNLRDNTLLVGLKHSSGNLRASATQRVDRMLEAGLEAEVSRLSARYGWESLPMKLIGYREWRGYFNGQISYEELRQKIITNTVKYGRRQLTWFKRNNSVQWFISPVKESLVVDLITTFLN